MRAEIRKGSDFEESETRERCHVAELSGEGADEQASIARARVRPGVTTEWHRLKGVSERYIIAAGKGLMEISGLAPAEVSAGDVVLIPPGSLQRITNIGDTDLLFYCVCVPPFRPSCYEGLDSV